MAPFVIPAEMFFNLACIGLIGIGMREAVRAYQKYENYGKPKRWNVDTWDRKMMERDSRLTGNVNRQIANAEAPPEFKTNSAWELERPFM
ncbi:hypothetical protein SeMB42_g04770 [Synchytrium endobioticum]|uniref:NADH dehydrogenase [ubiquinone] 1 alpha subcomplex subunit 1 n=1 Tax=Synchytrium endobioticum TaxID=286115 RepID=A0A507CVU3_9FUNG|nr:hypothetical protein SeLEV6574_g06994 [Synchytrium endobioticum]TPX43309.1 hypothetical protein SeMB42_g04770 [Synchytrium endobioticum]